MQGAHDWPDIQIQFFAIKGNRRGVLPFESPPQDHFTENDFCNLVEVLNLFCKWIFL